MRRPLALVALAGALAACSGGVASARSAVALERIGRFAQPDYLTAAPGDRHRLFVVERYGGIRVVRDGRVLRRPFLSLRGQVLIRDPNETVDQRGLLSMAFAPDYARTRRFYVFYIDRSNRIRVEEFRRSRRDPNRADPRSGRLVIDIGRASTQHHGGQLQFGRDGMLYISTGMGSDPATSQDPATLGGKILRIDPRAAPGGIPYRIPRDNPFDGIPGARSEIYALGLRNPWRFSFDSGTGDLLIGDVGDNAVEEVDVLPARAAGANLGWPLFEGTQRHASGDVPASYAGPALEHTHASGWCAVTGGYVVHDPALPALRGRYVYGDVCSGELRSARLTGTSLSDDRPLGVTAPYLVSFGRDALGRIYAVSLDGPVWRLRRR